MLSPADMKIILVLPFLLTAHAFAGDPFEKEFLAKLKEEGNQTTAIQCNELLADFLVQNGLAIPIEIGRFETKKRVHWEDPSFLYARQAQLLDLISPQAVFRLRKNTDAIALKVLGHPINTLGDLLAFGSSTPVSTDQLPAFQTWIGQLLNESYIEGYNFPLPPNNSMELKITDDIVNIVRSVLLFPEKRKTRQIIAFIDSWIAKRKKSPDVIKENLFRGVRLEKLSTNYPKHGFSDLNSSGIFSLGDVFDRYCSLDLKEFDKLRFEKLRNIGKITSSAFQTLISQMQQIMETGSLEDAQAFVRSITEP
jgi:hypothetical protein